MRDYRAQIGDLVSLDYGVYGAANGIVIGHVGPDVRIVYTSKDGIANRIRRRDGCITILQKKQNEDG